MIGDEYKSALLLFNETDFELLFIVVNPLCYRDNSSLIIPVLKKETVWMCDLLPDWLTYRIELTGKAIFDNYCKGVFSFIQPC